MLRFGQCACVAIGITGCAYGVKKEGTSHYDASACVWRSNSDNHMESSGRGVLQRIADARFDEFDRT